MGVYVYECCAPCPACIFCFACNENSLRINSIWIWPFRRPIPGKKKPQSPQPNKPSAEKGKIINQKPTTPYQKHFDMPKTNWIFADVKSDIVLYVCLWCASPIPFFPGPTGLSGSGSGILVAMQTSLRNWKTKLFSCPFGVFCSCSCYVHHYSSKTCLWFCR